MSKKVKLPWLRCPACNSMNKYFKVSTQDYQCRSCGSTYKANFSMETTMLSERLLQKDIDGSPDQK